MNSIQWRLFAAFAVVVLVAVTTIGAVALRSAAREIDAYDTLADELEMTRIVHWLTGYFDLHGSWEGVQPYLDEMGVMHGRRVVISDADGRVVADTRTDASEASLDSSWQRRQLRFDETDVPVGTVHLRHEFTMTDALRLRMARSIRLFLFVGCALAVVLALATSVLVSRPLGLSIRALAEVADKAADGDLAVRAPVPGVRELKILATTFNRMMFDLDAAATLRRDMVADIAHELRTPLSNILGYLEAGRDNVISDTDAMSIVESEVLVLARLVDDLQELSMAETGTLSLSAENTDMKLIIEGVVSALRPNARRNQVEITVASPAAPVPVYADPMRISQALTNLVVNAVTHSCDGGQVVVETEARGEQALVSVRDTGSGIAPRHLPHVFERFYRGDPSRSRTTGGHGLGLTIARYLIQAHGGAISAASVEGAGSCFTFRLPATEKAYIRATTAPPDA